MRRYTNEDHQQVATLPCINTILISAVFVPCAAKISARSSSRPSFTMISVLSLGVSIIHGPHWHQHHEAHSLEMQLATRTPNTFFRHPFIFPFLLFLFPSSHSLSLPLIFSPLLRLTSFSF